MIHRFVLAVAPLVVFAPRAAAAPCELPTPGACLERAIALMNAGDSACVKWFVDACESGIPDACAQIGLFLMRGTHVERDEPRAFAVSRDACTAGSALGCNNAFVMLRDGIGATKDEVEMRRLADASCALESADGCYLVGAVYGDPPVGGRADPGKSKAAIEKACQLGQGEGCSVLGHRLIEATNGYKKDVKRGVATILRACELGYGDACDTLGAWHHERKHGLAQDQAKSLGYFERACKLGLESGCANHGKHLAATGSGTLALELVRRDGKRVVMKVVDGDPPPVGAVGEVSTAVSMQGLSMSLTIAEVVVGKASGTQIELEVVADKSEITVDGKKVDHWKAGGAMKLAWKRAEGTPKPSTP